MENVLDIIFDYTIQNRLLDKKAVDKIMDILISEEGIEIIENRTIYTRTYKGKNNKDFATYIDGDIEIFLNRIYRFLYTNTEDYFIDTKKINRFEKYLINNLYIVSTIIHELEHALQNQYHILGKSDTLEQQLVNLELDHINRINDLYDTNRFEHRRLRDAYKQFYEYSFIERMADIKSQEKILHMIERLKKHEKRIYEYEQTILLFYKINGYKNSNFSPTIRFFMGIGKYVAIKGMGFNGLDYQDRLRYGLNLTKEEINKNKELIRKRRISN